MKSKFEFTLGLFMLAFGMFGGGYAAGVHSAPAANILVAMGGLTLMSAMLICAGLGKLG